MLRRGIAGMAGLLATLLHAACWAQVPSLFSSGEVLELTMPVNFDTLCRPLESPNCGYTPTMFVFTDRNGAEQTIPVEIRRREGWRAIMTNCQIPTLFVRFNPEGAVGSPFEGQSVLALTSHCGKAVAAGQARSAILPDEFEHYVVNEYLGYHLYNLVTDYSLRARLVRIRYVDPENARREFTRFAFFTEHFEDLARRQNARLLPVDSFNPDRLDAKAATRLALFQFMIGNTDWSIENQDNIVLLELRDGTQVPVLYDLDLSGLVNAHYAVPPPGIPIRNVKERHFMGYCVADEVWSAVFPTFAYLQPDVLAALDSTPGLGRGDRRAAAVYLDSFFDLLRSGEARRNQIVKHCRPWPGGATAQAGQGASG